MNTKFYKIFKLKCVIDRIISRSVWSQIAGLALVVLVVFVCLFVCSLWFHPVRCGEPRIWNVLSHFMNPGGFNRVGDGNSNLLVFFADILGMIFLSGMLIAVLSNMLQRRVDRVKSGQVYYRFSGHFVIVGYDKMTISLTKQLAERYPKCDIVLQTIQDASKVRHELFSHVSRTIENRITIVSGNRNSKEDLEKLRVIQCLEIFLLGEDEEYDHDSLNIDCLKIIAELLGNKKDISHKRCNVLFEYQSTFSIFQRQDLEEIKSQIDFVPFNFYETWAQKIFVDGKYTSPDNKDVITYMPLDGKCINAKSPHTVHLVIAGMSRMGIALGIQASHLCHFPNFVNDKSKKTRITFIDENADREMNYLKGRYRNLLNEITHSFEDVIKPANNKKWDSEAIFTDIEWHFIQGRIEHPNVQQMIDNWCREADRLLTIAICFEHPPTAIAAGLYLPDAVYDREIPVLIRQETSYSTLSMLEKSKRYKNVKPFGMPDNCYDLDRADDRLPMMVNYVYDCLFPNDHAIPETFPENKIVEKWGKLQTALKWSNRYNADMVKIKQRSFDINPRMRLDDDKIIELMAAVEHNRWNIEKLLMGYRTVNPEEKIEIAKNNDLKNTLKNIHFVHPDICAYKDLPDDVRKYDKGISKALPVMLNELQRIHKQ